MTILRKIAFVATAWLALTAFHSATSLQAQAQLICLVRADAVEQLKKQHGEKVTGRGIVRGGKSMVELLTGKNGSWTVVVTDVKGRSCIVANGNAWHSIAPLEGRPS